MAMMANNTNTTFAAPPFMVTAQSAFMAAWGVMMICMSTLFNSLAAFILIKQNRPLNIKNKLLVCVVVADLLQVVIGYVPEVYIWVNENKMRYDGLCIFSGFSVYSFAMIDIVSLSVTSALQCFSLLKPFHYRTFFQISQSYHKWVIAFTLVYSLLLPSLVFTGWSTYAVDIDERRCSLDWEITVRGSSSYLAIACLFYYILPAIVVTGSTITSLNNIKTRRADEMRSAMNNVEQLSKQEDKMIYMLIGKTIVWYVCWTPYCICGFMAVIGVLPPASMVTVCSCLVKTATVVNPMINFKHENRCGAKVCFWFGCSKNEVPSEETQEKVVLSASVTKPKSKEGGE